MADERTRIRAERLGILLLALGEEPTMTVADSFAVRLVPRGWFDIMSDEALDLEPGDLAADVWLALECSALGREIRTREWHALERLDALLFGDAAETPLPPSQLGELRNAVLTLGWNRRGET